MDKSNNVRKIDFSEQTKSQYNILGKDNKSPKGSSIVVIIGLLVIGLAVASLFDNGVDRGPVSKVQERAEYKAEQTPKLKEVSVIESRANLENPFKQIQQDIDVATAYKLTNVTRVSFDPSISVLDEQAKAYFSELFSITDFLVVERMQNHNQLQQTHKLKNPNNYRVAIRYLEKMTVPENLRESHNLILEAVKEQIAYFELMDRTRDQFNPMHPYVQTSNQKLVNAWMIITKLYPNEVAHNTRSFKEHLCALDFI